MTSALTGLFDFCKLKSSEPNDESDVFNLEVDNISYDCQFEKKGLKLNQKGVINVLRKLVTR